MFPIRDHNPSERRPLITYAIITANILVFIYQWPLASDDAALSAFFRDWALFPAAVTGGAEYHGLFTSMFLHAGIMHIVGNMLFLWIFGDNLEDQMGHFGFLLFYIASGLIASFAQIAADPGSTVPTVGASGAIAGVMGGYLLLFPRARVDIIIIFVIFFRIFTIPAWIVLSIWFGLQLFGGFGTSTEGGGIAYWAHAGGFIAGALLTLPVWLKRGGAQFWALTHGQPPHPETMLSPSTIPLIRRRR